MKPSERIDQLCLQNPRLAPWQALMAYLDQEHNERTASSDSFLRALEWTLCSEAMPDAKTCVLVWRAEDRLPAFARIVVAAYENDRWHECGSTNVYLADEVSHWMPIPRPLESTVHQSERLVRFRGSVTDLATDVCAELTFPKALEFVTEIMRFICAPSERHKFKQAP